MTNKFTTPVINPAFQSRLRTEVIAAFETSRPSIYQSWQFWLPLSFSFTAIAIIILSKTTQPNPVTELTNIEQELITIEQELLSDKDISSAIEFSNL